MKKFIAAKFSSNGYPEEDIFYYTDDFVQFYKEDDIELTEDELKQLAEAINSPWSDACISYSITHDKCDINDWTCEYTAIVHDSLDVSIMGYGNTEIEALEKCKSFFKELQSKYNRDNVVF